MTKCQSFLAKTTTPFSSFRPARGFVLFWLASSPLSNASRSLFTEIFSEYLTETHLEVRLDIRRWNTHWFKVLERAIGNGACRTPDVAVKCVSVHVHIIVLIAEVEKFGRGSRISVGVTVIDVILDATPRSSSRCTSLWWAFVDLGNPFKEPKGFKNT